MEATKLLQSEFMGKGRPFQFLNGQSEAPANSGNEWKRLLGIKDQRINDLTHSTTKLGLEIRVLKDKLYSLAPDSKLVEEEITSITKDFDAKNNQIKDLQTAIDDLKLLNSNKGDEISHLRRQLESMKNGDTTLPNDVNSEAYNQKLKEIEELTKSLEQTKARATQQIQALKQQIKDQEAKQESEVSGLHSKIRALESSVTELEVSGSSRLQLYEDANKEIENLNKQLQENQIQKNKLEKLANEIGASGQEAIEAISSTVKHLQSENQKLKVDIDHLYQTREEFENTSQILDEQHRVQLLEARTIEEKLREDNDTLRQKLESLNTNVNQTIENNALSPDGEWVSKSEYDQLGEEVQEYLDLLETYKIERDDAMVQLQALTASLTQLDSNNLSIDNHSYSMRGESNGHIDNEIDQSTHELKHRIQCLEKELELSREYKSKAESEDPTKNFDQELLGKLAEKEAMVSQLTRDLSDTKNELMKSSANCNQYKTQLTAITTEYDQMASSWDILEEDCAHYMEQLEQQSLRVQTLEKALQEGGSDVLLHEQIREMTLEYQEKEHEMKLEIRKLKESKMELEDMLESKIYRESELDDQIQILKDQVEELTSNGASNNVRDRAPASHAQKVQTKSSKFEDLEDQELKSLLSEVNVSYPKPLPKQETNQQLYCDICDEFGHDIMSCKSVVLDDEYDDYNDDDDPVS